MKIITSQKIISGSSLLLLLLLQINVKSQQQTLINQVMQNLTPNTDLIFADSALQRYHLLERMEYYGVPSVSIAVIHKGKVAWSRSFGVADVETGRKVDANTRYQAASLSKTVHAALVMKLCQQGQLTLNTDIRKYLNTWELPENEYSRGKQVTLKAILSHTAGLNLHGFSGYHQRDTLPDINAILDGQPPARNPGVAFISSPGTKQQYSGGGILISQKVLEDQTGKNYSQLISDQLLKPLKMSDSEFAASPGKKIAKNLAYGHDQNKKLLDGHFRLHPEGAADALWTTTADYARFISQLQQAMQEKPGAFLKPEIIAEMKTSVLANSALGFFLIKKAGEQYFSHLGANVGYRTVFYANMNSGEGVVIFTNSDNAQILDEIANSVAITYNWKNFYAPEMRKLVPLSSGNAQSKTGTYQSENPLLRIRVRYQNGALELNTRNELKNFERMYPTGENTFFVRSSPNSVITFKRTSPLNPERIEVTEGGRVLFSAEKR